MLSSTVHRVVSKPVVYGYSIAVFVGIDPHVWVEVRWPEFLLLNTDQSLLPAHAELYLPERPPSYAPTSAGDHVQTRLNMTYHRNTALSDKKCFKERFRNLNCVTKV